MRDSVFGLAGGAFVLLGVLAVGGSVLLDLPILLAGGGGLVGIGIAFGGVESIFTGRATIGGRRRRRETFTGLRGRLVGLFYVALGLVIAGGSVFLLRGGLNPAVSASLQELTRSDLGISIALVGLGIFLAFWSFVRVLGSDEQNQSGGMILMTLPLRLISLVLLVVGIGLIVFGYLRIVSPQTVETMAGQLSLDQFLGVE